MMPTDLGSQARPILPTSTRDTLSTLGLGSVNIGTEIGVGTGLIHATYHAIKQSPIPPSFLRTTGLVGGATTGGLCLLALGLEMSGKVDIAAEFRKPLRRRDGTQRKIYPDVEQMRNTAAMYIVSAISGAGIVAYRSGLRRGNMSRMVGGGCVGFLTLRSVVALLGTAPGKKLREL